MLFGISFGLLLYTTTFVRMVVLNLHLETKLVVAFVQGRELLQLVKLFKAVQVAVLACTWLDLELREGVVQHKSTAGRVRGPQQRGALFRGFCYQTAVDARVAKQI